MSEQTQIKSCCVSGHIHEGTPKGKFETVHGLNTYVTGSGSATIVFIPDIFGIYPNAKLLADTWAEEGGWRVLVPDVFEGDAVSLDYLSLIAPSGPILDKRTEDQAKADGAKTMEILGPWLGKHSEGHVLPLIEKFFKGVKAEG
jgi:dienelactone hydrolase